MLVAEVDGEIVAAVPIDGGRAIADPFRPTADVVGCCAPAPSCSPRAAPRGPASAPLPRVRVA